MSAYFASDLRTVIGIGAWPTARQILLYCWYHSSFAFPSLIESYVSSLLFREQYKEIRALRKGFQEYAFMCATVILREYPIERRIRAYHALPELKRDAEERRMIEEGRYSELTLFVEGLGRTTGPGYDYVTGMLAHGAI